MNPFKIVLTSFLLTSSLSSYSQNLLYKQDFENRISDSPEISWTFPPRPVTQAIVEYKPFSGNKSVRGNFNATVVDPITKLTGNPNVHLDIYLDQINSLKNWLPTADKIYISWWFKIDKCMWKGTNFVNLDPLAATAKFAYLSMNRDVKTSYYLSMSGGNKGFGVLQSNSDTWMKIWQTNYNISSMWTSTGQPYGADDKWHKLSFLIFKEGGQKYIRWWIDDVIMKNSVSPTGTYKIENTFIPDDIGFWYSKQEYVNLSTNIAGNNYCNGWQIDNFLVWDGVPVKPASPAPIQ